MCRAGISKLLKKLMIDHRFCSFRKIPNNMSTIRKEDIKQEVFDLYDDYAHNRLDRRGFMEKLSMYAVGGLTLPALMSYLMPDYAGAIQVQQNDPRIKTEYVTYPSPKGGGTIK